MKSMNCKTILFTGLLIVVFPSLNLWAQTEAVNPRPITLVEYELAKTFEVEDLDNDTYIKFENKYILDRYEMRKPIYITGDNGQRKRIDIYKLIAREGLQELGLMIFYTTEKGVLYKALVPNFTADGNVWERYFEDIHAIDKTEENFVLKLSYVLSRELSYQIYKGLNEGEVMDEHATYGSDICFPGNQLVKLANGEFKSLKEIVAGDHIVTVDPVTHANSVVEVENLVIHKPENYAITVLTLFKVERTKSDSALEINLGIKELRATPNHPMLTSKGHKEIGQIGTDEEVLSWNETRQEYESFYVFNTREITEGIQPVYSLEANAGTTLIINGVLVMQKQ